MGGTVAITLRTPDNKVYKMSRWTNIMPYFINNARLFKKDPKHIEKFLEQWISMKEDWEKNKDSEKFEFDMTPVYFPSSGTSPDGYGLVVVDMVNDIILTSQGYCSFERIHSFNVKNLIERFLHNNKNQSFTEAVDYFLNENEEDDPNEIQIIKELYDNNFITSFTNKRKVIKVPKFKDFYDLLKHFYKSGAFCEINISGFKIEDYEEYNKEELLKMKERIIELGFDLDEHDLNSWNDFLNEIEED